MVIFADGQATECIIHALQTVAKLGNDRFGSCLFEAMPYHRFPLRSGLTYVGHSYTRFDRFRKQTRWGSLRHECMSRGADSNETQCLRIWSAPTHGAGSSTCSVTDVYAE